MMAKYVTYTPTGREEARKSRDAATHKHQIEVMLNSREAVILKRGWEMGAQEMMMNVGAWVTLVWIINEHDWNLGTAAASRPNWVMRCCKFLWETTEEFWDYTCSSFWQWLEGFHNNYNANADVKDMECEVMILLKFGLWFGANAFIGNR